MNDLRIVDADLQRLDHANAVFALLDGYARDPMGDGKPLAADVKEALIPALRRHPTTVVLLAYADDSPGESHPVGIAICFLGFSTFKARPLLNIHDFAVAPGQRGRGIGRELMAAVERKARALGCCKLTLEVFEHNERAFRLYRAAGFAPVVYQEAAGSAQFLAKVL